MKCDKFETIKKMNGHVETEVIYCDGECFCQSPPSPDVVGDNGLKPCPFCGNTDLIAATNAVNCKCGASVIHPADEDATELWNNRV